MKILLWVAQMGCTPAILEIPQLNCLGICTKELHFKFPNPSRIWERPKQWKEVNKINHMLEEEALSSGQRLMVCRVAFRPDSSSLHHFKSLREEIYLNSHTNIQIIWFKVVNSCSHLESYNTWGTNFLLKLHLPSRRAYFFIRLDSILSQQLTW